MSRDGSVDLALGGETHRFRLAIGGLETLQEETDIGAPEHLYRLYTGRDHAFRDVRAILRTGLIGGGLSTREAYEIARGLDAMPQVEMIAVATLVMAAALEGAADEPLPERSPPNQEHELPNGRMAFKVFYESAAAMGLPIADMREMSLWQFAVYVAGYNKANNPEGDEALTEVEEDALWELVNTPPESEAGD